LYGLRTRRSSSIGRFHPAVEYITLRAGGVPLVSTLG
jgi:hypothetical protein